MDVKKGIGVSPGIAIGAAVVLDGGKSKVRRRYIAKENTPAELDRLDRALAGAREELDGLLKQQEGGPADVHRILQTHLALLDDREIRSSIKSGITEDGFIPEYAVARVMGRYIQAFESMKDDTFSTRQSDIQDVERRILRHLEGGKADDLAGITERAVIVARDLTPSQAASLDTSHVCGFATEVGGMTSHTAIVARSLGIPAVVGVGSLVGDVAAGDRVVVDGTGGNVLVNPDEKTLEEYREKSRSFGLYEAEVARDSALPTVSTDGVAFTVLGNIEFPREVERLVRAHADGVGLFRTEFLYLDSLARAGLEETHIEAYREVVAACPDRPVTIRTLDMGSDKMPLDAGIEGEPNPALGSRSLRFCLEREELFKVQLRAILRVSEGARVKMMFPMVSSVEEFRRARALLEEAKSELRSEGHPFDSGIQVGIMVEVPSAALLAGHLAREVDFFSIGSNDLIQYTLAVDRVNERVAGHYQPAHPAILHLVKMVVDAGHEAGIDVSLCGEMAANPELAVLMTGLGLTSFSVTPGAIPELKRVLRRVDVRRARGVAERVLALAGAEEILAVLRSELSDMLPDSPF